MKLGPELQDVSEEIDHPRLGETPRWTGQFWRRVGAVAGLIGVAGCGYQPLYGGQQPRYDVSPGHYSTASFEAVQSALEGVCSELGAAQALGSGPPRITVEILRVDERSIGARLTDGAPLARGSEIIVVGRALVYDKPESPARVDTGDMSRAAQYASGVSASADAAARSRAVRDAARSLGKALARAALGLPEPADG